MVAESGKGAIVLNETIRLMSKIGQTIDERGGWRCSGEQLGRFSADLLHDRGHHLVVGTCVLRQTAHRRRCCKFQAVHHRSIVVKYRG